MVFSLVLGSAAILYGLYTAYLRATAPEKLGKLEAMRRQWGDGTGTAVHLLAYTVAPILVGVLLVARAMTSPE
jgi:hypothetical protein